MPALASRAASMFHGTKEPSADRTMICARTMAPSATSETQNRTMDMTGRKQGRTWNRSPFLNAVPKCSNLV